MAYQSVFLQRKFIVEEIVTIHYFEYMSNFTFPGESHDFWEFVYVDRGEIDIIADDERTTLHKGDIIFHKPNEFHNVVPNGVVAPNLVVIAFCCHSMPMSSFENQRLTLRDTEQNLLAQIIKEGHNAFSCRFDDPYLQYMPRKEGYIPFGAEQLIRTYLEQLLILLYRRINPEPEAAAMPAAIYRRSSNDAYIRIHQYLEQHVGEQLSIEKICEDNLIGRSQLQKLFRERHHCGVIDYFSNLKITAAKQLIRNNQLNFTQISDHLGYTSVHYFSRQFKKLTGMTPSEYASSIKSLSE